MRALRAGPATLTPSLSRKRARGIACGTLLALAACANLPDLTPGACGNGVVDPGEDCDGFGVGPAACLPPGDAHACHLSCAADAGGQCPTGWGCGLDGLCRHPALTFVASARVEDASLRLAVGDLDGDGRADLLLTGEGAQGLVASAPRVSFSSASGLLAPTVAGASSLLPALGDLDADGHDDLIYGTASLAVNSSLSGLAVLQGTAQRALLPRVFSQPLGPAELWPLLLHGVQGNPARTAMVALASDGDQTRVLGMSGLELSAQELGRFALPLSALAGAPVQARFDERASAPCQALALAFAGDTAVRLLPLCDASGALAAQAELAITLPSGDVIQDGVLAADLDGDGHLDLLIRGQQGRWAAFGDGQGHFGASSAQPGTAPVAVTLQEAPPGSSTSAAPVDAGAVGSPPDAGQAQAGGPPPGDGGGGPPPGDAGSGTGVAAPDLGTLLAVAPLADGSLVLLSQRSVLQLQPTAPGASGWSAQAVPLAVRSVGEWTSARVADLNADGLPDLVAASSGSEDVDLFIQVGGLLDHTTLTSQAPVAALAVADLDGDGVGDVAWAARAGADADALQVAFGRAGGAPSEPVEVARPGTVDHLEAADFDGQSSVQDLAGALAGEEGLAHLAVWSGQGRRQLATTLTLQGTLADGGAVLGLPLLVSAGRFSGAAGAELAVVGVDQSSLTGAPSQVLTERLWWVDPSGGRAPVPGAPLAGLEVLPSGPAGQGGSALRAALAHGDLDGDGREELLLVAVGGDGGAQLAIAPGGAEGLTLGAPQALAGLAIAPGPGSQAELLDLDGDGHPELAFLAKDPAGQQALLVCSNRAGALDASGCQAVALPEAPEALATLRTGAGRRLLVLTRSALYLGQSGLPLTLQPVAGVPGGVALAVGDSDGDGLDDLFLSDGAAVQLWLGQGGAP